MQLERNKHLENREQLAQSVDLSLDQNEISNHKKTLREKTLEMISAFEHEKRTMQERWLKCLQENDHFKQVAQKHNLNENSDISRWGVVTLKRWARIDGRERLKWDDLGYIEGLIERVYIISKLNINTQFSNGSFLISGCPNNLYNTFHKRVGNDLAKEIIDNIDENTDYFLNVGFDRNKIDTLKSRISCFKKMSDFNFLVKAISPKLGREMINIQKGYSKNWELKEITKIVFNVLDECKTHGIDFNASAFQKNIGDGRAHALYNSFVNRIKAKTKMKRL